MVCTCRIQMSTLSVIPQQLSTLYLKTRFLTRIDTDQYAGQMSPWDLPVSTGLYPKFF